MEDILIKDVTIITMGENIKNLIYLVECEIERLEKCLSTCDSVKGKELFNASIKYYKALKNTLEIQLNEQI